MSAPWDTSDSPGHPPLMWLPVNARRKIYVVSEKNDDSRVNHPMAQQFHVVSSCFVMFHDDFPRNAHQD